MARDSKMMVFSTKLWARHFAEEFLNPNLGVPWEDITMTDRMIAYHIDDPNFYIDSKQDGIYKDPSCWLWGNVITNKANRSDIKFARLFCPEGKRMNWITHATFKKMSRNMKHEYITPWSTDQILKIKKAFPSLSKFQAHTLFRALVKHPSIECVSAGGRCRELEDFHIRLGD